MTDKLLKHFQAYILVYVWIVFLILWQLLLPGYVLTLDMVFVPQMHSLDYTSNMFLWRLFIYLLSFFLPGWFVQKFFLVCVFLLAGLAMHSVLPCREKWAKYFAGILYLINPFVYSRFLAGQINHLLAYALMPFLVWSFFKLLERQDCKNVFYTAILLSLVAIFSLHILYMVLFTFFIMLLVRVSQNSYRGLMLRNLCIAIFSVVVLFLVLNFYWILNFSATGSLIGSFDAAQSQAFATATDSKMGILFNVLAMYGFWGENYAWGHTVLWAKDILPYWYVIFIAIFSFVLYGFVTALKNRTQRFWALTFFIVGLMAFVFSIGVAHPYFAPINNFLYDNLPLFRGFRDPQKWVALLVLSYCFLGGIGLENLLLRISERKSKYWTVLKKIIIYGSYTLVIVYTFTMFGGFGGQLKPVFYPQSWYEVNNILNDDQSEGKVWFLPWHLYMSFEFNNNRLVTNPASRFFDREVIQGDNIEIANIYSVSKVPQAEQVENFLSQEQKDDESLSVLLNRLDVKYVLYATDTEGIEKIDYQFLNKSSLLEKIYQKDQLILYQVRGV